MIVDNVALVAVPQKFFVGRHDEITMLLQSAEMAKDGRAQTLWIEGEAGCGKTWLVNRWLEDVAPNFRVFRAEADELASDVSLELTSQIGSFLAADGFSA